MPKKNIIFDFKAKAKNKRAITAIEREFKKAGAEVVTTEIESKTRRSSGVTYKKVNISFADSQIVELWIKSTGDIFKVKVGGAGNFRELPIKNQDSHYKAIIEIVKAMTKGRKVFQKKLARKKIKMPKGHSKTRVNIIDELRKRIAELDSNISDALSFYNPLVKENEQLKAQIN